MLSFAFTALLALPAIVQALTIEQVHPAVVRQNVRHGSHRKPVGPLSRNKERRSTLATSLELNDHWVYSGAYFLHVQIGTPPQPLQVLLDTGSSDFVVPSSRASSCLNNNCPGGSFSFDDSASFARDEHPSTFQIAYLDGSSANGTYGQDAVSIGRAILEDHVLAIADEIEVSPNFQYGPGPQYGILGLSFDGQEASVCASARANCEDNATTPTIVDSLYDNGLIQSRSYSLFLDDRDSQSGSILFGGVDTAKFKGDLVEMTVQRDLNRNSWTHGMYVSQDVLLTSVSGHFNGTGTTYTYDGYSSTVILDSGAGPLSLPPFIYEQIIKEAPIALQHDGSAAIFCKHLNEDAYLTFGLRGANGATTHINVPMSNLIMPIYHGPYRDPKPYTYRGEELCIFGVARGAANNNMLGDPLLRSAYTVFNLDQKTISIAQASCNKGRSRIRAIGPGPMPLVVGTAPAD